MYSALSIDTATSETLRYMARTKQRRTYEYLPYTFQAVADTHLPTPTARSQQDSNPRSRGRWSSTLTTRLSRRRVKSILLRRLGLQTTSSSSVAPFSRHSVIRLVACFCNDTMQCYDTSYNTTRQSSHQSLSALWTTFKYLLHLKLLQSNKHIWRDK